MSAPYQYIVLLEKMNQRGVVACQAAHAAGESIVLPHDRAYDPATIHLCALMAKDTDALEALAKALGEAAIPHVVIREDDPPYNGVATAVGIAPTRDRERVRPHVAHFKVLR